MKLAVGVDIGGTNTKTVIASEDGEVLLSHKNPTPSVAGKRKDKIEKILVKNVKDFLNSAAAKKVLSKTSELSGIGIGIAGLIDREKGRIIQSPNISAANGVFLREVFEKEFSLPVMLENDANAYAYGEKWIGAGKDLDSFIVLTLGTGLGGGLIYNGKLYEGPLEVGHMVIVPSGRYCTCGNTGCLESYASGRAIVDRAVSSLEKGTDSMLSKCCDGNIYKITPEVVFKTALEGDSLSREVFREVGQFLGIGIANLINILGIDAVIIGGGLIGGWDMFIEELSKEAHKRAFKILSTDVKILRSALPKDGGAIGSAGLLFAHLARGAGQKTS
jgi:glucokinase